MTLIGGHGGYTAEQKEVICSVSEGFSIVLGEHPSLNMLCVKCKHTVSICQISGETVNIAETETLPAVLIFKHCQSSNS